MVTWTHERMSNYNGRTVEQREERARLQTTVAVAHGDWMRAQGTWLNGKTDYVPVDAAWEAYGAAQRALALTDY